MDFNYSARSAADWPREADRAHQQACIFADEGPQVSTNFRWLDAESCMFTLRTWFLTLMSSCGTAPHTRTISKTSWPNAREGHMVVGGRVCTLPCGHCLILRLLSCKLHHALSSGSGWYLDWASPSPSQSVKKCSLLAHCEGPALKMALLAAATCDRLYSLLRQTSKGSSSREKRKKDEEKRKKGSDFNMMKRIENIKISFY